MNFILRNKVTATFSARMYRTAAIVIAAVLVGLTGCQRAEPPGEGAVPEGALLTIDGYPVPKEEFLLFLEEERALTAAYFGQTYGAQVDEGFWSREFDGQTPSDYAKESALNSLLSAKMQAILLHERGLAEDISYEKLEADREKTNRERAEKLRSGEIFYGLTEYDAPTYYAYVAAQRLGDLYQSQYELAKPTQEQLRGLYNEDPPRYAEPPSYTCRISYADGGEETVILTASSVSKEDEYGQRLYEELGETRLGETLYQVNYLGREAEVKLLSAEVPEPDFARAGEALRLEFSQRELWDILRERIEGAKVELDREEYDAIQIR